MRKALIAVTAVLSLLFAVPAFATEGSQPPQGTDLNFDQMKAAHLKNLDERMNSLQEEKTCVQAADNREKLIACIEKHKAEARKYREEMKKGREGRSPSSQRPTPAK